MDFPQKNAKNQSFKKVKNLRTNFASTIGDVHVSFVSPPTASPRTGMPGPTGVTIHPVRMTDRQSAKNVVVVVAKIVVVVVVAAEWLIFLKE